VGMVANDILAESGLHAGAARFPDQRRMIAEIPSLYPSARRDGWRRAFISGGPTLRKGIPSTLAGTDQSRLRGGIARCAFRCKTKLRRRS
jgi:hypothetical protein